MAREHMLYRWICKKCGNIQPAAAETTRAEMGQCDVRTGHMKSCGGELVKQEFVLIDGRYKCLRDVPGDGNAVTNAESEGANVTRIANACEREERGDGGCVKDLPCGLKFV